MTNHADAVADICARCGHSASMHDAGGGCIDDMAETLLPLALGVPVEAAPCACPGYRSPEQQAALADLEFFLAGGDSGGSPWEAGLLAVCKAVLRAYP